MHFCFLFHFPSDSFTLFLILNLVSFDSSRSRKEKRIYNAFLLAFFSIFHWIRLHFFNRQTWFYSIRADLEKGKESTMPFCLLSFPFSTIRLHFFNRRLRFIRFEPIRGKRKRRIAPSPWNNFQVFDPLSSISPHGLCRARVARI